MSGDAEQEYFADGMVDEIITGLSRIKWLFVISRAFDRVHHTGKFGENAVTCGVDNASAELANHWEYGCLVPLEITYRALLVCAHKSAVPSNISEPARLGYRGLPRNWRYRAP
jgi:hypothetical protein